MHIIRAVPTNIITGALGAGKTSLVKQLLKAKPSNERWAVLVNEFGEVGLDAAILSASTPGVKAKNAASAQSVFLREVPGGCMCCASGLPMQIALNQLLAEAKPDRLLIEPTGLGHPKELLQVLGSEHYKEVISLNSTLCLIDARKLNSKRWREHQTFRDQLEIADIILATKGDLYTEHDMQSLSAYLDELSLANTPLKKVDKQSVDTNLLNQLRLPSSQACLVASDTSISIGKNRAKKQISTTVPENLPSTELVKVRNEGDGFYSCGWVWPANYWFDYSGLMHMISSLDVVRIKGLMITSKGIFEINGQTKELNIEEHDEAPESRLEIIVDSPDMLETVSLAIEEAAASALK